MDRPRDGGSEDGFFTDGFWHQIHLVGFDLLVSCLDV